MSYKDHRCKYIKENHIGGEGDESNPSIGRITVGRYDGNGSVNRAIRHGMEGDFIEIVITRSDGRFGVIEGIDDELIYTYYTPQAPQEIGCTKPTNTYFYTGDDTTFNGSGVEYTWVAYRT